jgi:beta-lactamase class C
MKIKIIAGVLIAVTIISMTMLFPAKRTEPLQEEILIIADTSPLTSSLKIFDKFLQESLDSSHTVGAAISIVQGDSVVLNRTFGVRRAGNNEAVTRNTVFRLASVSKGFSGVLALLLEKDGLLSMNDPVKQYIPDLLLKDSVNTADLNIGHLLNHTSGLVPHAYDNLAEAGIEIRDIIPELSTVNISAPPGELYGYQNVMFSLFDTIASQITYTDYSLILRDRIFQPLDMKNASAGFDSLVWNPDVAFPHISRAGRFRVLPMHTGYYNLMPAAGVNASISDMELWIKALLGYAPEIMGNEILGKIATPQIYTPLKRQYTRNWDELDGRHYSYGWRIFDYKGRRILYHGGYVRGYRAEIAVCPRENLGLVFLQNSPNRLAAQVVPTFFNILFSSVDAAYE